MKLSFLTLAFLALILGSGSAAAQVFQPVGNGILSNRTYVYASEKLVQANQVYFACRYYDGPAGGWQNNIFKWDGTNWSQTPLVPRNNVTAIAYYMGELYVAASNSSYTSYVYKLTGNQWVRVLSGIVGGIADMEVHNNELFLVGYFNETQSGGTNMIAYNGSAISTYPGLQPTDSVSDIEIINGDIWLAGMFFQQGWNSDTAHVRRYNSQTASFDMPATKSGTGLTQKLFSFGGKTYTYGYSSLYEIRNDSAVAIANSSGIQDHAIFNGYVYFIRQSALSVYDGQNIASVAGSPQYIGNLAATTNYLYGIFRDTVYNNITYNHAFKMGPTQLGFVQGQAFIDNNGDCSYNATVDNKAHHLKFNFSGAAGGTVYLNQQGAYNLALPAGSYTISGISNVLPVNKYIQPAAGCGTNSFTINANQTLQRDIALEHDGTIDAETYFTSWFRNRARFGFQENFRVVVNNPGTTVPGPVTLTITLAPTVSFVSASPAPTSQSANVLTYQYNSLAERDTHLINLIVKIDTATNSMGDNLCFYSTLTGISNDAVPANNSDTLCVNVVGACDPNDKRPHVAESLPGISNIDYHIRFQNVGTDTAFNVVVIDTLETYFDPSSLEMIDASHPFNVSLIDSNILKWSFQDIRLPDSTTNPDKSQGFIRFKLDVNPNLQVGDIIDNDAEIYFDFQPPVHTNHAQTAIVQFVSLDEEKASLFEAYPNPVQDKLWLHNPGTAAINCKLISLSGKTLMSWKVLPETQKQVDLSQLSNGVYLLNAQGQSLKIIVQH